MKTVTIECDRCGVSIVEGEPLGTMAFNWEGEFPDATPDLCQGCSVLAQEAIAAFMQGAQAPPVAPDDQHGFPECKYAGGMMNEHERACRSLPSYTIFVQVATCHACPHRKATEAPAPPEVLPTAVQRRYREQNRLTPEDIATMRLSPEAPPVAAAPKPTLTYDDYPCHWRSNAEPHVCQNPAFWDCDPATTVASCGSCTLRRPPYIGQSKTEAP